MTLTLKTSVCRPSLQHTASIKYFKNHQMHWLPINQIDTIKKPSAILLLYIVHLPRIFNAYLIKMLQIPLWLTDRNTWNSMALNICGISRFYFFFFSFHINCWSQYSRFMFTYTKSHIEEQYFDQCLDWVSHLENLRAKERLEETEKPLSISLMDNALAFESMR